MAMARSGSSEEWLSIEPSILKFATNPKLQMPPDAVNNQTFWVDMSDLLEVQYICISCLNKTFGSQLK
jgi:hypothetical protein